jgi:precorrin-3B synthase
LPSIRAAREMSAWSAKKSPILDPEDPRRRVAACTGAPICMQATTNVRDDATRLAASIGGAPGSGIVLHVSGCGKGCAHPQAALITLVGRSGCYDLVVSGAPSDSALLRNLTVDEAAENVRRIVAGRAEGSTT